MHRSILFVFFALFATAFAAYQPQKCGKGIKKTDAAAIRTKFTNAKGFCNYYLKSKRSVLPVSGKPFQGSRTDKQLIKRFNNACECISKKKASKNAEVSVKRDGAKARCVRADNNKLSAAVKQPAAFCKQWTSVAWRPTNQAPFGAKLSVRSIYNACVCVLNPVTTTTAATTTTSATPSSSASSSVLSSSASSTTVSTTSATTASTSSTTASTSSTTSSTSSTTSTTSATSSTTTTLELVTSTLVLPISTASSSTAVASPTAAEIGATKKKMAMRLRGRQYSNAGAGEVALE